MSPEPRGGSGSEAQVHGQSSRLTPRADPRAGEETAWRTQTSFPAGNHRELLSGDVCQFSSALQHHPHGEEPPGEDGCGRRNPGGSSSLGSPGMEGEQGWRRAESGSGGDRSPGWRSAGTRLICLIPTVPGKEPFPPEAACEGTSPDSRLEASRSLMNDASAWVQTRL